MDWIMGKNTILEVAKYCPEKIIEVLTNLPNDDKLIDLLREKKIPIKKTSKQELTKRLQSESHQQVAACVKRNNIFDLKTYLAKEQPPMLVALDQIYDPQNFGAILRSMECFGAAGVIWSKNRGVDITPVVSKVSCGATELLSLIKVSNLCQSLQKLQDIGYEIIVSDTHEATALENFSYPEKCVIVMGSEEKGVQPLIRKIADHRVHITQYGKLQSLNVAQSTAVFLYDWKSKLLKQNQ